MDIDKIKEEDLLSHVEIAEAAERYEDMCRYLKKLVELRTSASWPLTVDERNLFSVAYKNVVGAKRQSWRALSQPDFPGINNDILTKYRSLVENELEGVCNEVNSILEKLLKIPDDGSDKNSIENRVFYLKMSGDYYRYLAEFKQEKELQASAEKRYQEAYDLAKDKLPETHPTRLGLVLNYSVCCYEILDKKKEACTMAKKAFDRAIEKLDTLGDSSYKDATLIMQLLRDNLTLWTAEGTQEDVDE